MTLAQCSNVYRGKVFQNTSALLNFRNRATILRDCIILFRFSEHQVVGALVCHFAGIGVLYVLQASVNLVGSPAGCRVHESQTLEGFNFGSYLHKRTEPAKQENITSDQ